MDMVSPEFKSIGIILTEGLGASAISIPLWMIVGKIAAWLIKGVMNLINPFNEVKIGYLMSSNLGLAIGLLLKVTTGQCIF
ncbi:MAG: hypothetical protein NTV79_01535 [Candidatus Aureabacteria bacterium]|nr:hypothetical protein [Candidatus Auribacterota bacterium]